MNQQLKNIKNWLEKEYANIDEKIYIDYTMIVIENAIKQIKNQELFDKRFTISKDISVLVYNSDTIEVHSTKLNDYKSFVKSNEQLAEVNSDAWDKLVKDSDKRLSNNNPKWH